MGLPARSQDCRFPPASTARRGVGVGLRVSLFVAILLALVNPVVGLLLLSLALTWVLVAVYEWL